MSQVILLSKESVLIETVSKELVSIRASCEGIEGEVRHGRTSHLDGPQLRFVSPQGNKSEYRLRRYLGKENYGRQSRSE